MELQDLIDILNYDVVQKNCCIEINFCIKEDTEYDDCWLGKMIDRNNRNQAIFWYGLVRDGSQAYDYNSLEGLLYAKVFKGKCLKDIWNSVIVYSIDGCNVEDRLPVYKGETVGPLRSGPQ